tara:strand:- start:10694 stop:11869 length:1176 start_codon:yes stop_codon:yes gene_type:complete
MPPYKPWTISPLNPYGAYKPEEYQAETSALRAHVEQRRAEAEAERLAAAQRLREEQIARQWSREMPLEMLQRKQEAEVGSLEQEILYSQERERREDEEFRIRKLREAEKVKEAEALKRLGEQPKEEPPKDWYAPDKAPFEKSWKQHEGALSQPSLNAALGIGGALVDPKTDYALFEQAVRSLPQLRESKVGQREEKEFEQARNVQRKKLVDRDEEERRLFVNEQRGRFRRDWEEQDALRGQRIELATLEVGQKLERLRGGPSWNKMTPDQKQDAVSELVPSVKPWTLGVVSSLSEKLNFSLDWSRPIGKQVKILVDQAMSEIELGYKKSMGSISAPIRRALNIATRNLLQKSLKDVFTLVNIPGDSSDPNGRLLMKNRNRLGTELLNAFRI